jgi:hypothetical protein
MQLAKPGQLSLHEREFSILHLPSVASARHKRLQQSSRRPNMQIISVPASVTPARRSTIACAFFESVARFLKIAGHPGFEKPTVYSARIRGQGVSYPRPFRSRQSASSSVVEPAGAHPEHFAADGFRQITLAHHAAPGMMQSIFRSASRRETLGKHSKGGRRDGGLKMDWTKPLARA